LNFAAPLLDSRSLPVTANDRQESAVGSLATPTTAQHAQTTGGQATTATVTLLPTAAGEATGKKMSSGSVVAIAVAAVVAAVVLLVALLVGLCCWRRRRSSPYAEDDGLPDVRQVPRRNASVMSNAGLLGPPSGSNATTPPGGSPPHRGLRTPGARSLGDSVAEHRNSRLMVFDQRLNPTAFMQHDDGSRASFVSMQDNRDYTRTLNVSLQLRLACPFLILSRFAIPTRPID
jgi:cell wall integrity and stress response component